MAKTPRNTSADITSSTTALCISRRMMKTVTTAPFVRRAAECRGKLRPASRVSRLLHGMDVEGLGVLVGVAFEGEIAAHAPDRHFVVQRDDADIADADLRRLLQ